MKKTQYVSDLKAKDTVSSIFLVKYISVMAARDGRSYLNIILTDKTGDLEARKWNEAEKVAASLKIGDFCKVEGKVNLFQSRQQVIINSIIKTEDDEISLEDFINKAKEAPDKMFSELVEIVEGLSDVYIKDLIRGILFSPDVETRLKKWQAGKSIHHAYQSGLLEHILSCTQLSLTLAKYYKLNENYVVAGAVLHDLCKIYELSSGPSVEYTEEGKLVGHLSKGVELVDRFCAKIPNFPSDLKMHVKHILLAHHGEYEYGSPKIPQTKEAMLVHLIDLMDSKLNSFDTAIKNDSSPGRWTNYIKHLDRIIYKEELPFYPDYISLEVKEVKEAVEKVNKAPVREKKPLKQKEIKNNSMANLLKDLKIED